MLSVYFVSLIVMVYVCAAIHIIIEPKSIKVLVALIAVATIPVVNTIAAILSAIIIVYGIRGSNVFK